MTDKKLLTRHELAEILGVHTQTIYNMTKEGMPRIKMGYNLVRYDPEDVMEWLKTRGKKQGSPKGRSSFE